MLPGRRAVIKFKSRGERPIDGRAADLQRLRDGRRPHAVGFDLLDLGRIDGRLAPLV